MTDLFGEAVDEGDDGAEVTVSLVLHDQTEKAWRLSDGGARSRPRWAPKSQVRRGEGRDEDLWTMPRWLARDRGWL